MALCEELAPQMLRLYLSRPGNHLRIIPMGSVAIALEGKPPASRMYEAQGLSPVIAADSAWLPLYPGPLLNRFL